MRTKTIQLYKFEELSPEAKEKAIEHFANQGIDYEWWDYFELDNILPTKIQAQLTDRHNLIRGLNGDKPITSLFKFETFYFDIDRNNYLQFKNLQVNDFKLFGEFLRIPHNLWEKVDFFFTDEARETNTSLVIQYATPEQQGTHKQDEIIRRAEIIFDDLMNKALSSLKEQYNYLTSKEAIIDNIEANNYEFTKDGMPD